MCIKSMLVKRNLALALFSLSRTVLATRQSLTNHDMPD